MPRSLTRGSTSEMVMVFALFILPITDHLALLTDRPALLTDHPALLTDHPALLTDHPAPYRSWFTFFNFKSDSNAVNLFFDFEIDFKSGKFIYQF